MRAPVELWGALLVLGCQYAPLEVGGLACDTRNECPAGLVCEQGHCQVAAPDAAAGVTTPPCAEAALPPIVVEVSYAHAFVTRCDSLVLGDLAQDRLQVLESPSLRVGGAVPLPIDPRLLVAAGDTTWVAAPGSAALVRHRGGAREVARFDAPGPVTALAPAPQPLVVFVEGALVPQSALALVADDDARPVARSAPGFTGATPLAVWEPRQSMGFTASDAVVRRWELDGGALTSSRQVALEAPLSAVVLSDDGVVLAVAEGSGVVDLDPATLGRRAGWATGPGVVSLALSPKALVVATADEVTTWARDEHRRLATVQLPASSCSSTRVRQVALSPGGAHLFVLADCGRSVTKSLLFRLPAP